MQSDEKQTIDIVKKVTPAVVSISVSKNLSQIKESSSSQLGPGLSPFLFDQPETKELGKPEDQKVKIGGGSGFVADSNGIILTNKHVVIDPDAEYVVITSDEKEYAAKVLTRDPVNDIAILKIDAKELPVAKLSNSKIEPGQTVLAIGNALGLFSNTVSKGIVSGLARKISAAMGSEGNEQPEVEELRGVIQTDVAINQGNSGGPLINTDGEVVGINTAVIFGAQNIGFAIPVQWAKKDLEDLIKFGRIIRPYIGLRYIMLNKDFQKKYKLPVDYGALIVQSHAPGPAVVKNSPADKAGLKENDIVLAVNSEKIDEKKDLADMIQLFKAGDEVELTCLRKEKEHKMKVLLEERK